LRSAKETTLEAPADPGGYVPVTPQVLSVMRFPEVMFVGVVPRHIRMFPVPVEARIEFLTENEPFT
jgi:hypothetical protein